MLIIYRMPRWRWMTIKHGGYELYMISEYIYLTLIYNNYLIYDIWYDMILDHLQGFSFLPILQMHRTCHSSEAVLKRDLVVCCDRCCDFTVVQWIKPLVMTDILKMIISSGCAHWELLIFHSSVKNYQRGREQFFRKAPYFMEKSRWFPIFRVSLKPITTDPLIVLICGSKSPRCRLETRASCSYWLRNVQLHGEWPCISGQLQFPSSQGFGQRGGTGVEGSDGCM